MVAHRMDWANLSHILEGDWQSKQVFVDRGHKASIEELAVDDLDANQPDSSTH